MPLSYIPAIPADAPKPLTRWRHWKGECVTVLAVGVHSESSEILVTYLDSTGRVWMRPLHLWAKVRLASPTGHASFAPEEA
jgi:hypothetical protein